MEGRGEERYQVPSYRRSYHERVDQKKGSETVSEESKESTKETVISKTILYL